ncbi:MAG TPA: hypothetical protein VGG43_10900 [Acidimicrobiales bacterium]|jgi:hypothetical protein
MGSDVSQLLGEPEIAGSFVKPKGTTKKMNARIAGGAVGGVVGATVGAATSAIQTGRSDSSGRPPIGNVGYLAVTGTEIALIRAKPGALKAKIVDEVLITVPRADIARVDFDGGIALSRMTVCHTDGTIWEFEAPRVYKQTLQAVAQELGASGI